MPFSKPCQKCKSKSREIIIIQNIRPLTIRLSRLLSFSAPEYFEPSTIAHHLGSNWALKAGNLRKLIRNLEDYFHEGLKKDADFAAQSSKLNSIARTGDLAAIADLLELVAAAAVTCETRGEFVQRIMSMTPENQSQMKVVLEQSLSRLCDYDAEDGADEEEDDGEEAELVFDGTAGPSTSSSSSGVGDGLFYGGGGAGVAELEKALADARRELAAYKSQASEEADDSERAQKKLRALVEDLQERLVKRQEELVAAELELKKATTELEDNKAKVLELEEQKAQLADDLDVATAKADQLRQAEATVVSYRKKLEGLGVVNQQKQDLEDQAASYLRQIMDLEAELKKIPGLESTIGELQSQIDILEKDNTSGGDTLKASAVELAQLKSRVTAAEKAKALFEEELKELRAQQESEVGLDDSPVKGLTLSSDEGMDAASKETTMRLELENKALREELEELKRKEVTQAAAAAAAAAEKAADTSQLQAEIDRLVGELAEKEAEKTKISSDKDKLEAYTKRTLAKFQEKYLVALQECKAKLKEKQDKVEALENRSSSEKTAQKREERLLSSTIYELGLAIMQDRLKER